MKIYIPFNSNDFNNVFSTLSISPRGFYPLRKYSFRRAYESTLNPLEYSLIAYQSPTFSQKDFDKDYGFTVNLEVDIEENTLSKLKIKGFDAYEVKDTLYLFDGFKLIFRRESEMVETFAKSLKSIETKFSTLAKEHSILASQYENTVYVGSDIKLRRADKLAPDVSFEFERKTNKILGSATGFIVGLNNSIGGEFGKLKSLTRELENLKALFLNNITHRSDNAEKVRILACLMEVSKHYDLIEPLDENILLNSTGLSTADLAQMASSRIHGHTTLLLVKEGLIAMNGRNLPMQLRIELTMRCLNAPFNPKYPDNYIKRLEENTDIIRSSISSLINDKKKGQEIKKEDLLYLKSLNPLKISISENSLELRYFESIIDFFVNQDGIFTSEILFSHRAEILIQLGNHLKFNIAEFNNSEEKTFLLGLLNSFKNLRLSYDPSKARYESFKSIAILFTSGRDINKFYDNVIAFGVEELKIALGIWGAVYGYSSLPKTITEDLLNEPIKSAIMLSNLKDNLAFIFENDVKIPSIMESKIESKQVPIEAYPQHNVDLVSDKEDLLKRSLQNDKSLNDEDIINATISSFKEIYTTLNTGILNNSNEFLVKSMESSLKIKSKKFDSLAKRGTIKKIVNIIKNVI